MVESCLMSFSSSIWQTVPSGSQNRCPADCWQQSRSPPKNRAQDNCPTHSVLGMNLSKLNSFMMPQAGIQLCSHFHSVNECICHAKSADIDTIVILGTRILFSSILYLLHWTILNFLLPNLSCETESSAGALNHSLDDCIFLLLVSFYH